MDEKLATSTLTSAAAARGSIMATIITCVYSNVQQYRFLILLVFIPLILLPYVLIAKPSSAKIARLSVSYLLGLEESENDRGCRARGLRCTPVKSVWGDDMSYNHVWTWPVVLNHHQNCNDSTSVNITLPAVAVAGRKEKPVKRFIVLRYSTVWKEQPIPETLSPFFFCHSHRIVLFYTSDRKYMSKADIVEFHDADTVLRDLPPKAFPEQLFMVLTWESPIRGHSHLQDDGLMGQYNLLRSYRLDSDLVMRYFPKCIMELMKTPVVNETQRRGDAVMFLTSNCESDNGRERYIQQLMGHAEVHSYGRCLHNRNFDTGEAEEQQIRRYRFYIAMENSNCHDYVSEKLSRGWMNGVIPVVTSYHGNPDYRKFSPNNHSYLDIKDYESPEHLARELKAIAKDRQRFESFLTYRDAKAHDISQQFRSSFLPPLNGDPEGWCDLAGRMQDNKTLAAMTKRVLKGDHSCAPRGQLAA